MSSINNFWWFNNLFPGLRSIVSSGPYNIVRHPGYLGELIMIFACAISIINMTSIIIFVFFVFSLLIRINVEEIVLSQSIDYLKYKEKVKWKLFPFFW